MVLGGWWSKRFKPFGLHFTLLINPLVFTILSNKRFLSPHHGLFFMFFFYMYSFFFSSMYVTGKLILIFGEILKGLNKKKRILKEIVMVYRENGERKWTAINWKCKFYFCYYNHMFFYSFSLKRFNAMQIVWVFGKKKKTVYGKCLCYSINIRSRNTNPIHPPWLCPFWASVTCHALQFCLYFMMHMTLLNFYGTVNDTVAIHHWSEVFVALSFMYYPFFQWNSLS